MWLVWIVLALIAVILFLWGVTITALAVGSLAGDELCPQCGLSLGLSDRDRQLDAHYSDPRFRSKARDRCLKCGWRRAGSES